MKIQKCRGVGSLFEEMLKTAQQANTAQQPVATTPPPVVTQQQPRANPQQPKSPVDNMQDKQRSAIITNLSKVKAVVDQMLKAPFLARNPQMAQSLQAFSQVLVGLANQQVTPQQALAQMEPFSRELSSFQAQWQQTVQRGSQFLDSSWKQINEFQQFLSRIK